MPDETLLDVAPSIQIQVQVNSGGLDAFMAQMGLDVRDGMAAVEHVHSPAVTKTMDGIDILEALWRKNLFQILSADTVNTMAGELLSPLIDKKPVLI